MKIVVPYVPSSLYDRTRDTVIELAAGRNVVFELLDGDSAYWHVWRDLWNAGHDFAVVEQDIVPGPSAFDEFDACPEPWCAHQYDYSAFGMYAGTGCVRFRAELLTATAGLMERVARRSDNLHPPMHWCRLDAWMQNELHDAGYCAHIHQPPVEHLDPGNSHRCVSL